MSSTMTSMCGAEPISAGQMLVSDPRTPLVGGNKQSGGDIGRTPRSPRNRPLNMLSASSPLSLIGRVIRELEEQF